MSKLEDLIKRLCPDGVEYMKIGEIANYRRGSFPQPYTNKSYYGGEKAMPFVQVADIEDEGFRLKNETKQTISQIAQPKSVFVPSGTVVCSIQGTIGRVAITQYDCYIDRTIAIFESFKINVNKRFFAYCIEVKFGIEKKIARGSTLKTITKEEFAEFNIPVPPLEVQCEIVRILDNFTESSVKLSEKLSAELKARQKQYEYYSSKLFENCNEKIYAMADVAKFVYGYTDKAKDNGDTRFIRITDINEQGVLKNEDIKYIDMNDEAKKSLLIKGDIIMARTGATYGKTLYFDSDLQSVYASFLIKIIPDNTKLLNKYYWHFTKTPLYWNQANKLVTTGGQPQFNTPALKRIEIPIPSLEEQKRIIDILDKLDKMCTDISEDLSAEIEARRKQYEYYRDKLLTFKELKKEA